MFFLGDNNNKPLSEKIASGLSLKTRYPEVISFPDSEMRVRILDDVKGQDVYLLKSLVSPVNDNVFEFQFLIDALLRHGAGRITGIVPYLGYMRADHVFRTGEAVPLEVVIKGIESVGLSRIWIC